MKRDLLSQSLAKVRAASQEPPAPDAPTRDPIRSVSSVAESLKRLSANAVQEVPADQIQGSRFSDRLDINEGIGDLVNSIRDSGQQVPVLLRRIPGGADRFEVVYGRRRIAACRDLGVPVRALIADFDEEQSVIAQGLENAARKDTTFIERALFAAQVEGSGMPHEAILRALGIDKTGLSRMRRVVSRIPETVIRAIGPAPGRGRSPWMDLADLTGNAPEAELLGMVRTDLPSEDRLTNLIGALRGGPDRSRTGSGGATRLLEGRAELHRRGGVIRIKLLGAGNALIASELEARISELILEHLNEAERVASGQPGNNPSDPPGTEPDDPDDMLDAVSGGDLKIEDHKDENDN